jgi:glutaredoxin
MNALNVINKLSKHTIHSIKTKKNKLCDKIGLIISKCEGAKYCFYCSNNCINGGGSGYISTGTFTQHDCPHCKEHVKLLNDNLCDSFFIDALKDEEIIYCYKCRGLDYFDNCDDHCDYEDDKINHKITKDYDIIIKFVNNRPRLYDL